MPEHDSPRMVQLHVVHDLGGGTAGWLADFLGADSARKNLVLKSITHGYESASSLALFDSSDLARPLRVFPFEQSIPAVLKQHPEYKAALDEVLSGHGVDAIIVSSLIGHSLEVLDTGLPTLVVNHDYFPYCPAVHLFFGGVCTHCDAARLEDCASENRSTSAFREFPPHVRKEVREQFVQAVLQPNVTMVVPTASVQRNLERLDQRFKAARFVVVAHGQSRQLPPLPVITRAPGERLRILVLGQLSFVKGAELLREALAAITRFADVFLVGTGEIGQSFSGIPHVEVVLRYEPDELPGHARAINPHLGLLTSVVAETFSFTLSEMLDMGLPVAAPRVGSFEDRIEPGVNGFLYDPDVASLIALIERIDAAPDELNGMRASMRHPTRTAAQMVADYHALLPAVARLKNKSSIPRRNTRDLEDLMASQALHLADLWKELKSLHLQLTLSHQQQQKDRASADSVARRLRQQVAVAERRTAEASKLLMSSRQEIDGLRAQNEALRQENHRLAEQMALIFRSKSWRILGIARRTRRGIGKLPLLARCLFGVATGPRGAVAGMRHVFQSWRAAGILGLKSCLLSYAPGVGPIAAWSQYRASLETQVLPLLREQLEAMSVRPVISILMATYETPATMLREALDSVLAQLYPEWELCIVDDGSKAIHVRAILSEYAARDARIKVRIDPDNGGVARASNRALQMASGEYVVLMDHDDALEEQALFRVAQCITDDSPDVIYSDEVIVAADAQTVTEFVYRPAYSPELLRGHPYIVHLAGFRTDLVRRVGGFDESLRISQDYDLILRCCESATRVVHIPEILYRWRTHTGSAGHQMMDRVMAASTAILQRHHQRSGRRAIAGPGFGFNFFENRYEIASRLRVAIIIPTRNQGTMLRACVESLVATIENVEFDIFVVDHESDDPITLEYLDTARDIHRVLRYEGPFNFSAINNMAVSEAGLEYSHYLFCNNDIEAMESGWLERMLELAQQHDVGIVGAKLFYSDGITIQHAGVGVGLFVRAEHYGKFVQIPKERIVPGYYGSFHVTREVTAVTAACMLVRRDAFEAVGGFDESLAVGFGDVDLCLRVLSKGYRVLNCAAAALIHHESATRGQNDLHPTDSALFEHKWRHVLAAGDPYYNPGFSATSTTWQPKKPLHWSVQVKRRVVEIDRTSARQRVRVGDTTI